MIVTSHLYDGNISIPGCDKNMPGCLIAAARHNRPTIIVYGGSIKAGKRTKPCAGLGQEVGQGGFTTRGIIPSAPPRPKFAECLGFSFSLSQTSTLVRSARSVFHIDAHRGHEDMQLMHACPFSQPPFTRVEVDSSLERSRRRNMTT